ncbi:MAG: FecR domain-containing protein [Byssovorax sp.]
MSRRSVPRIAPADLRDHAEEARLDRVWARIDADLPGVAPAASRRPIFTYLAIAAAFAAFAGGVVVGKVASRGPMLTAIAPVQTTERTTVDVLAAGTEGRNFQLPGGGQLQLQPGTTVEVERGGSTLTLKLLHGAASVDTSDAQRVAGLMIVAGEAQLNTQAGSVVTVRRNQDDMDVNVNDGSISITSPGGTQTLGRGGRIERLPLHTIAAVLSPTSSPPVHAPLLTAGGHRAAAPRLGKLVTADGPAWYTSYEKGNEDATALALLRQQPGGAEGAITNARSPQELMAISTIAGGKNGDPGVAIAAMKSVVDRFPEDVNAQIAAISLARIYKASGKEDLSTAYLERANKLNGPLAEDALCRRIKGERLAGHKDEAIRQANEYVAKYPDGRCKDEVGLALASDDGAGGAPAVVVAPAPTGSAAP